MERWWNDLQQPDPEASRALLNFSTKPQEATAFFKERLLPLKISEEDLAKLIVDLGSDDDGVWKPAFEKLEYFDPRLTLGLSDLMNGITDDPSRHRLVEVLCDRPADSLNGKSIRLRASSEDGDFNFVADNTSWWAEAVVARLNVGGTTKKKWTRAARAITLLEHFGTPDAIAILKEMATGHPDAAPTKAAVNALDALGSK
jgi:hypothetical protein